jgi:hypothetical protein
MDAVKFQSTIRSMTSTPYFLFANTSSDSDTTQSVKTTGPEVGPVVSLGWCEAITEPKS